MTANLQQHLEEYAKASWQIDHQRAMECRELEALIDLGLALLETIRRIDRRLRQNIRSGSVPFRKTDVEAVAALYEQWYAPCTPILRELERLESEGYMVDNAEAFRDACRSSPAPGLEPEALAAAERQFQQGKGRPLGEVMDAIRRRAV